MSDLGQMNLTDSEFKAIQKLVYDSLGIYLKDTKKLMVRNRLTRRLRLLNLRTFTEYLNYLEKEDRGEEFQEFTNAITTNKTDFFRQYKQFEILEKEIFPGMLASAEGVSGRSLRIWSAGCSTGEEPYTLAIVAQEFFEKKSGWEYKILATDINSRVLDHCEKGVYHESVLTPVSEPLLRKYFLKGTGAQAGYFQVKPVLKSKIFFRQLNLFLPEFPIRSGVDIIFCRNVMIYFDKEKKAELFKKFHRLLKPGGWLFIGHSESLTGISEDFSFYQSNIYRKG
jgi:chemotaxis protein methyltransferase CheR